MNSSETIREAESGAARTLREAGPGRETPPEPIGPQRFREYAILRQLPAAGGESDVYVAARGRFEFILKLYRYRIAPKTEVVRKIMQLGAAHPRELIRVYEFGFDEATQRWFEVQEFAAGGTLRGLIDAVPPGGETRQTRQTRQKALFLSFLREVSEGLKVLHENGILHLDLKPSNVLARTLEPLDFVLTDFGISNTLDPELSKKFTAVRGTPMYQPPESWSGAVGKPSDWWSAGMIALEIASGRHPFEGLSQQVVASLLMTKAIEIPDNIPPGERELLRGLLTRDASERWGYGQVSRWLAGERGIPVRSEHTESPGEGEPPRAAAPRAFAFMGQKHTSLETLARAIAADEMSWAKGRELLMRGNIRSWLEGSGEFEKAVDMDLLAEGVKDPDEQLFRFVHHYGKPLPFVFMGKAITRSNLLLCLDRSLSGLAPSGAEALIAEKICGGGLPPLMDFYLRHNEPTDELNELRRAFAGIQGETPRAVFRYLNDLQRVRNNLPWGRFDALRGTGVMSEIEAALLRAARDKNGNTALMHAVSRGDDPETAAVLLEAGADVNAANEFGVTALMAAARSNRSPKIIAALLGAGADVNARYRGGGTALTLAAMFHVNPEVLSALLAAGAGANAADEYGVTALIAAVQSYAAPEAVAALIEAGANVNAAETLSGETALMKAAREDYSLDVLTALIKAGADLNAADRNGATALVTAVRNDAPENIKALIKAGADANHVVSEGGVTVLMAAAQNNGNPETIAALIEAGADVNAANEFGMTALMTAAQGNAKPEIVEVLLEAGADVNAADKKGSTALLKAAQRGHSPEIIIALLKAGADATAADCAGNRAADYAAQNTALKDTAAHRHLLAAS